MEKKFDDNEWKKFLEEEYIKEANLMEDALFSDEDFPDMEMTDEEVDASFDRLVERLKADGVFREEQKENEPEGRKVKKTKVVELQPAGKKKKSRSLVTRHKLAKIAGFVVVCTLTVFAAGMTSEANRNYFIDSINYLVGNDTQVIIGNDNKNENPRMNEVEARKEIEHELEIELPVFMYVPDTFTFKGYKISELNTYAYLEYNYKDSVIDYFIRKCDENDKSVIFSLHGKEVEKAYIEDNGVVVSICEVKDEQDRKPSYVAQWNTGKVFYQISGKMEKEEFEKLIKKMKF